ncbi:MAG: RNA methyltransferase [Actinomycetota bacterium]|nr:RNA methyltransferase [Actinomycetota bacterium]
MARELVTSPSNAQLKRIRRLRARKHRDKQGLFFVEGIQPVTLALRHGASIEQVVIAPEVIGEHPVVSLVYERAGGAEVVEVSREAFASISARDDPTGVAAVVRSGITDLGQIAVDEDSLFVALDEVGNPGNLGAIVRTLDAVGGDALILMGSATDPWHPTAVKASMGTIFARPIVRVNDFAELRAWAKERGIRVLTTSAKAELEHWDAQIDLPALLVFGSEGQGLSREVLDAGDLALRIPIEGSASSLNLAIAASVMLYEVQRRRRKNA